MGRGVHSGSQGREYNLSAGGGGGGEGEGGGGGLVRGGSGGQGNQGGGASNFRGGVPLGDLGNSTSASASTSASQIFKKTAPKNVHGEAEVELEPGPQMDPERQKSLIKPVENDDSCSKKDHDKH